MAFSTKLKVPLLIWASVDSALIITNMASALAGTENFDQAPYNEVKGDLFSCPESYSLAHCISADCHMGKGIAVLFKKNFKGQDELLSQNKKTGDVAILKRGGRFIYYLITKKKYWNKPTYDSLKLSLQAMREHCRTQRVEYLAMPKIGCGLDRLSWPVVSELIRETFKDTNVKITIYYQ